MKEYENGFTTKSYLEEHHQKSSFGEEVTVRTKKRNISMSIIGCDYEVVNMNVREAKNCAIY